LTVRPPRETIAAVTVPSRSADTTREAESVQIGLLRAASPSRRLGIALRLTATVISAARRALTRSHPHESTRERDLRFVALHYGADLAAELRAHLARRDAGSTPRA